MEKFRLQVSKVEMTQKQYNENLNKIQSLEDRLEESTETIRKTNVFLSKLQDAGIVFKGNIQLFFDEKSKINVSRDYGSDTVQVMVKK